jgi:predicted permease
LLHVLNVIIPIFALILAGYIAGKSGKLSVNASTEINRFVVWLALPAQMFDFTAHSNWQELWQPGFIIAFSAGALAVYFALLIYYRIQTKDWTVASFQSLSGSYANTGYMGIPLLMLAFGESGLGPGVISTLVVVCALFATAIIFIELGVHAQRPFGEILQTVIISLFTNPLLLAPICGALWAITGIELYPPIRNFISLLGAAASPCALVAIGLFLVQKTNASAKTTWGLVFVKLIVQPLIVWIVADPILNLPTFWVYTAVLLSALPTGTGPFMLAQYYHADGLLISRVVMITTLGSLITLSILVWLMSDFLRGFPAG